MKKVAVTGGLSSGKSSVCHFLKHLGAYTVSADEIVHQLLSPHTQIGHKVLNLLGQEILKEGHFDRAKIAEIVFVDPKKLKKLEEILHPAVFNTIDSLYLQVKSQKTHALFVAEIPLLFESDRQSHFEKVVVVIADPNIAKKRFQANTAYSFEEFERRMARQLDPSIKATKADFTIKNNGSLAELETITKQLYQSLI